MDDFKGTERGGRMKCEDCKYHSVYGYTHFCDSKNGKRKTVRIKNPEADIPCKWADEEKEVEE